MAEFLLFFSSAHAQYSCLGFPAVLQNNQKVPQLAHPAFAADQLVLPKLYQLCKLPLGQSSTGCICFLLKWKMLSSKVMFPNVSCITPFWQLIIELEVAKNGLPRMIVT